MMMGRLTARTSNGVAYLANVKATEQEVTSPYENTLKCILQAFGALAAYEDLGTVEKFKRLKEKEQPTDYVDYCAEGAVKGQFQCGRCTTKIDVEKETYCHNCGYKIGNKSNKANETEAERKG
jgi:DNA-directed RNA polymerase subunit RPC12/RpoP